MRRVNYVEYQHSYAHALAGKTDAGKPVISAIRAAAFKSKDPQFVFNLINKYVFKNPNVIFTEKETEFRNDIKELCFNECNAIGAYYRCANALSKAEEFIVWIDNEGNLVER